MRTALRFALAAVAALALAASGCEAGFKDITPPSGSKAAKGADGKAAFAGPSTGFVKPDVIEDTGETPAEDPGP